MQRGFAQSGSRRPILGVPGPHLCEPSIDDEEYSVIARPMPLSDLLDGCRLCSYDPGMEISPGGNK